MEYLLIKGGKKLKGRLSVEGAKNSVLPVLAAAILNSSNKGIWLSNIPRLNDVKIMYSILQELGVEVKDKETKAYLDTTGINRHSIPEHLMRKMRSSIFLMGPLLGRLGRACVSHPGGCSIGARPIDLHLKGLNKMGVKITEKQGSIEASGFPRAADIHLDYPSVGATENLVMAASLARGKTVIRNAAREPEIVDLQNFLNAMGAKISGAGTEAIKIKGVESLSGVDYEVIPDRIVAGTYLIAAAATGGEVLLENVIPRHLEALSAKLKEAGVNIETGDDYISLNGGGSMPVEVRTYPYPGFSTDLQPPMLSFLTRLDGVSRVIENVFESRFRHVEELCKMGASIERKGRMALVRGGARLTGALVEAGDLRAAAALVVAGLAAEGETRVHGLFHLDRGYEKMEEKLRQLDACIERCVVSNAEYRRWSS